jgi:tetratricopeptide (TPR) repeat protein
MSSVIMLVIIGLSIVGFVWMRRRHARAYIAPVLSGGVSRETLALDAFAHGNTYLAEGKFDEATAAFHKSRELDPKRAHVADRLAEVQRRQHAAGVTRPITVTS